MLTETSGKKRVTGKFANQDSSRSVYWIATRDGGEGEKEKGSEKREDLGKEGTEAEGTSTL